MNNLDEIIEIFPDEEFLKADGFDEAIIGVDEHSMRLAYSVKECLNILMKDMDYTDALEYFSYNVSGAYVGERTPIWIWDNFEEYEIPQKLTICGKIWQFFKCNNFINNTKTN